MFEYNGAIQTLYSFCPEQGCPVGKNPVAGVIEDTSGDLYGTTSGGANHKSSTIFRTVGSALIVQNVLALKGQAGRKCLHAASALSLVVHNTGGRRLIRKDRFEP